MLPMKSFQNGGAPGFSANVFPYLPGFKLNKINTLAQVRVSDPFPQSVRNSKPFYFRHMLEHMRPITSPEVFEIPPKSSSNQLSEGPWILFFNFVVTPYPHARSTSQSTSAVHGRPNLKTLACHPAIGQHAPLENDDL